jgi:uncharacterized protein YgbK (DUF1537 family)
VEAAAEAAEAGEVDLETAVEEAALEADSVIVAVVAREEDEELPVVEDAVDSATGAAEEELAVAVEALLGQRVDRRLSSNPTDTPVSSLLAARKTCSSPRT